MFAFYLFLVSVISLSVLWGSSLGAVDDWLHIQQGTGYRAAEGFVSAIGWALAAGLVWFFHWRSLRGGLRTGSRGQPRDAWGSADLPGLCRFRAGDEHDDERLVVL